MGVDVFGRGTYGGGGLACDVAIRAAFDAGGPQPQDTCIGYIGCVGYTLCPVHYTLYILTLFIIHLLRMFYAGTTGPCILCFAK